MFRSRAGSVGRAVLLAAVLLPAAAGAAAWKTLPGDDPRRAARGFDDAGWRTVALPASWRALGYRGLDGTVWFRGRIRLGEEARLAAARDRLGLLLGPPAYGGYEVYAGGRPIGRSRGWGAALPFPFPEVFRVPRDAVETDGTLALALRVRRIGWASDRDPEAGPVGEVLQPGPFPALADRARVGWDRQLAAELPALILAALFAAAGFHHLLLYARRRPQVEHLWFGLLALAFALNTAASTFWIYQATVRSDVATRLSDSTGHLAAALAMQFLWAFFSVRPISGRCAPTSCRTGGSPSSSPSGPTRGWCSRAPARAGSGCCRCSSWRRRWCGREAVARRRGGAHHRRGRHRR